MTYDSDFESQFFPDDPPLIRAYGGPSEALFLERRKQAKELQAQLNEIGGKINSLVTLLPVLGYRRRIYKTRAGWKQFRNHVRGDVRRNVQELKNECRTLAADFVGRGERQKPKRR